VDLLIRLTPISPTHHRLAIQRADGSTESRALETRSCLRHDLVHFALETEAGLTRSFWGLLARGTAYADLTGEQLVEQGAEIAATERVVGALQGALEADLDPAAFVASFGAALRTMDEEPPAWLTADLVARVRDRMRRLEGHWRATRHGTAMELRFRLAR
jgi:hypothetical protein